MVTTISNKPENFRFIDLFAGIGGFRCGLSALGGECVFTSEWDKFSAKTYSTWFGDTSIYTEDIRDVEIEDIPPHDLLAAGFPCQPFSLAGVSKKASLGRPHGFNDQSQGNLFFQICRITEVHRPKILLLENVKNLKSHDKGRTWDVIQQSLIDLDYAVFHKIIDAKHWVPQHRERIFIVALANEHLKKSRENEFHWPDIDDKEGPAVAEILDPAPNKKYMLGDKTWSCLQGHAENHREKGNGFGYGLCDTSGISRTLSARYHKDGAEILITERGWRNPRRLTPNEAKRLMGFDDHYAKAFSHADGFPICVSDTQAYRQFGNSVVPYVVEYVGRAAISYFSNNSKANVTKIFVQNSL